MASASVGQRATRIGNCPMATIPPRGFTQTEVDTPTILGESLMDFLRSDNNLAVAIRQTVMGAEGAKYPHLTALTDWLDSADVMQTLHISDRTLQTWRTQGVLPYSQIGAKMYYKRRDVEQLLQNNYIRKEARNDE